MMDHSDIEKIEKIIRDRKSSHAFLEKNSQVYNSFIEMERRAFTEGELPKTFKELIAVGISVVVNCESCMEWHIAEALRSGATQRQVIETLEVAVEMGGGPATVASRFALKVLEYYRERNNRK